MTSARSVSSKPAERRKRWQRWSRKALTRRFWTVPTDGQARKLGYHYVVYGPNLRIAYAATTFTTRRSIIAKRGPVIGRPMRAMAEAAKIMHTDLEFTTGPCKNICALTIASCWKQATMSS